MLTGEEIEKIKEEEYLRHQVRSSLSDKKRNRLWTVLNSAFGLWFLSTIVVGLFSYGITSYLNQLEKERLIETQKLEAKRNLELKIKRLDIEIESRLSQFLAKLEECKDTSGYFFKPDVKTKDIHYLWDNLKRAPIHYDGIILTNYEEYRHQSLVGLIIELDDALQEYHGTPNYPARKGEMLRNIANSVMSNRIFWNPNPTLMEIWNIFRDEIITDRWEGRFPYTDCGVQPFC